jgi:hypothetical protein
MVLPNIISFELNKRSEYSIAALACQEVITQQQESRETLQQ